MSTGRAFDAVLFDLDGTVLDTAPDLLAALNVLRARRGLAAQPLEGFRSQVSRGARAMLGSGLPGYDSDGPEATAAIVREFLDIYLGKIYADTVLFDGMAATLDALTESGVALAIVTNKPEAMARELLQAMGLLTRFPVLLGGDSLAERKPHPLPVLTACARISVSPQRAMMVGDDRRDIESGRSAGCSTIAVTWGYADPAELVDWNADAIIAAPDELLPLVRV